MNNIIIDNNRIIIDGALNANKLQSVSVDGVLNGNSLVTLRFVNAPDFSGSVSPHGLVTLQFLAGNKVKPDSDSYAAQVAEAAGKIIKKVCGSCSK